MLKVHLGRKQSSWSAGDKERIVQTGRYGNKAQAPILKWPNIGLEN